MRALLLSLLLLLGCSETAVRPLDGAAPPSRAHAVIEVSSDHPSDPHVVDFGEVFAGEVREKVVQIRNIGTDTLQLRALQLPEVGNFALVNEDEVARLLAPNASTSLWLSYSSVRDEGLSATLIIESNDAEASQVGVTLLAEGLAPAINLDPPSYDFGNRELGCVGQVEVSVANIGRAPLVLDAASYDDFSGQGELSLSHAIVPGDTLDPGESTSVTIHYVPQDVAYDSGVLHVLSNDPSSPDATAQQFGLASYGANQLDQFLQEGNNATDILFVVDNSCSMSEEQSSLATNFASFMQIVDALDVDYHLGVVSTDVGDGGALQGTTHIITPNTPDPPGTFSTNVNLGIGGSASEQGFHSAWQALGSPMTDPGNPNYGFLRDEAGLRLVFVSDEAEQSGPAMGWAPTDYVDWFRSLKANPDHVVISDITGGMTGCSGAGGNADPAVDYVLASNLSGGISASICDPSWVVTLQSLAWLSQSFADTFELSLAPVPETAAVSLNGVPVFVGWIYEPDLNAVVFDADHVPDNGDLLDIEYVLQGECGD